MLPSTSCIENVTDEEDEEFQDALESLPIPSEMDLATSIEETVIALNLFLNNHFDEARQKVKPWSQKSMYHATCYGTIMYMQAALTFDAADIQLAVDTLKESLEVCQRFRKNSGMYATLSKIVKKPDYNLYTEEEIHAELCYAECLLERALLTFIQDENLISFVRGALKIRSCYQSYKECLQMLQHRQFNSKQKMHFESGVNMGVGAFNLLISRLPTKILKLLEFVGFSGNKEYGLAQLEKGSNLKHSLRGPMCSVILMAYHTIGTYVLGVEFWLLQNDSLYLTQIMQLEKAYLKFYFINNFSFQSNVIHCVESLSQCLGTADGDIKLSERLLSECLQEYPKGAIMLFFAGRIAEIKGNMDLALSRFEESIASQQEWKQFHHLCYWELMWCHAFKCDWLLAFKYAERLRKESRWSKATYAYQQVAFLMMCEDRTAETTDHINRIFEEIPKLKQRVAGKSIPVEKFAVRKARKYAMQQHRLVLPAFELIYVWNGFSIISENPDLLKPILERVERELIELNSWKDENEHYAEDLALCLLLRSMCLKGLNCLLQAEQCLTEVSAFENRIKYDHYIIPYSLVELALLHMQQNRHSEARPLLEKAKADHQHYSLESRLHFRIHAALTEIRKLDSKSSLARASNVCAMDDRVANCDERPSSLLEGCFIMEDREEDCQLGCDGSTLPNEQPSICVCARNRSTVDENNCKLRSSCTCNLPSLSGKTG